MYYNIPKNRLTLSEILSATKRQTEPDSGFPYTKEVCRCRYCLYCKKGKCALQSCCCMSERIKAHSCTFAEVMNTCFEDIKDSVFHFRLRIAIERATELQTCFIERGQKTRFYEGLNQTRRNDHSFMAQTFLLSCSKNLWERAKDVLCPGGYLQEEEMRDLVDYIDGEGTFPSHAQAIRMKGLSRDGNLDTDTINEIMGEEKPNQKPRIRISFESLEKYFCKDTSPKEIEQTIFKALDEYYMRRRVREDRDAR